MTRILAATMLLGSAIGAFPPGPWQEASGYLRMFAPAGPRAAAYHIYVSRLGIDKVLEQLVTDPSLLRPPGAWTPTAFVPVDAFGQTGGYDRSKLARLYGSKRALVAHGPRGPAGLPTEAWTLISPYPSDDMTRLEPGTMLIVLDLGQTGAP